jgi:tetraacyldisaccharide 4'-kinase
MKATRPWAWPLVPVYSAALAAQDAWRGAGLARERRLEWPVISVGSVSTGGAGKTPVTIALANLLSERGWTVDVLSRGYGRKGRGVARVDLEAADPARRFGDEPTVIARRTGLPVWVGADRYAAGSAAERSFAGRSGETTGSRMVQDAGESRGAGLQAPRVHILDDGMQHRRLARSFNLVLVTRHDLEDVLLPAGNLREPLTALRRADALGVREEELARLERPLRKLVGSEVPLWTLRRALRFPAPLGIFAGGLRPLAFCGLARPENFAAMLAKSGCGVVDTVVFADHHRYSEGDITELIRLARAMEATGLITTEKDAVKLSAGTMARLEAAIGPLIVVSLEAAFVYESPVMRTLATKLQAAAPDLSVGSEVPSQ